MCKFRGVTMKNIARWTGHGGSYRNIQRFYKNPMDWLGINLLLLKTIIIGIPDERHYVLAFDEVVEDKPGKKTYGLGWFYSSILGKAIPSIGHHVVSLVNTEKGQSFVLHHEQTVKGPSKKKSSPQSRPKEKKRHPHQLQRKKLAAQKGVKTSRTLSVWACCAKVLNYCWVWQCQ